MLSSCASISATWPRRKKLRKRTSLPRPQVRSRRRDREFQRQQRLRGWARSQLQLRLPRPLRHLSPGSRRLLPPHRGPHGLPHRQHVPQPIQPVPLQRRQGPERRPSRRAHHQWRRDPLRHRPRRGLDQEYRCDLQRPARHPALRWLLVRRQQRPARRALAAHRHLVNVILYVRGPLRVLPDKAAPARRKACARVEHHNNFVRVARLKVAPAALQASVPADLLRDSRSVLAAVDRVGVTIKRRSARNVLAREFRKLSRASRSMHANRRRVAGHSSKSDMRKVNASCIRFVHAQVWDRAGAQLPSSRLFRSNVSHAL
jgi:hypothetical protein